MLSVSLYDSLVDWRDEYNSKSQFRQKKVFLDARKGNIERELTGLQDRQKEWVCFRVGIVALAALATLTCFLLIFLVPTGVLRSYSMTVNISMPIVLALFTIIGIIGTRYVIKEFFTNDRAQIAGYQQAIGGIDAELASRQDWT